MKRVYIGRLWLYVLTVTSIVAAYSFVGGVTYAQGKKLRQITVEDIFDLFTKGRVTTVTKTNRLLKKAPMAVTVITRQQIEETGAVTIADVLRLVPGLNVRFSPMGSVIGIRSLGSTPFTTRVLLLIDGVPYNSPDKGGFVGHPAYEDFFPVDHIKRIEVVKGPGSALYGQNAFQGIVNIITRDAEDINGTELEFRGGNRDISHYRLTQAKALGDFQYSLTGKYKRQDGPMEFQRDRVFNSGDLYLKLKYKDLAFSYLFHRDTFDPFFFELEDNAEPEKLEGVDTLGTEQSLNFLAIAHDKKLSTSWTSRLKFLYNRRKGNTCASCHSSLGRGIRNDGIPGTPEIVQSEDETNQRFWLNAQFNFSPLNSRHNVIFGGEYQYDRTTKNIFQRSDLDPDINTAAGFVQDEMSFLEGNLITTAGLRVDQNEFTDASVSPSASVVYLASENLVLRGSFGRAFRQPTWNDLFISQRFLPLLIAIPPLGGIPLELRRVGNPDLKTEKINTAQLGAEYFFLKNYSFKIDVFYSLIEDYIQTQDFELPVGFPPGFPFPPRPPAIGPGPPALLALAFNRPGNINTAGGEIEFRARPSEYFSGIFGYAYQNDNLDPRIDSQSAYVPRHKFTTMVNFKPFRRFSINFNLNSWSSFTNSIAGLTLGLRPDFAPGGILHGEKVGDSYVISHLKFAYEFFSTDQKKFTMSFQLRNLFDQEIQQNPMPAVDTSLRGTEPLFSVYYNF